MGKNANWLAAYTIYTGVILQVQLDKGPALIKYLDIIHWGYWEYFGKVGFSIIMF